MGIAKKSSPENNQIFKIEEYFVSNIVTKSEMQCHVYPPIWHWMPGSLLTEQGLTATDAVLQTNARNTLDGARKQ